MRTKSNVIKSGPGKGMVRVDGTSEEGRNARDLFARTLDIDVDKAEDWIANHRLDIKDYLTLTLDIIYRKILDSDLTNEERLYMLRLSFGVMPNYVYTIAYRS